MIQITPTIAFLYVYFLIAGCFAADKRPNIIFLISDDQCTYSLGCYGNTDVKTPNIDQLAADGMIFDNHYDTTAICMASRANVMTGMYEFKTGCNFNHGPMIQQSWQRSYPVLLRNAGYRTAFAGKFGFEVAPAPGEKSTLPESDFDVWGGGPGQTHFATKRNKSMKKYAKDYPHATTSYGAFGSDFVRESAAIDAPFCLSISFKAPHRPVQPDPQFDDVYAGMTFTKPKNYGRERGTHFSEQSRAGRQYDRFETWDYDKNYDGVMAKYHQLCYAIDVAVGMIRKAVEEAGVADNTVIIYTSDNGYICGSHGYGSKVLPYEESTRVPLIVFDPRHKNSGQGLRSRALTGNIDFAPTILALAGVEPISKMDGRSLLPLYDDPEAKIHDSLFLINCWGPAATQSLSVVTQDWKYIYWYFSDPEKGMVPTEELYHTKVDGLEMHNAAKDTGAADDLAAMRKAYDQGLELWKNEGVDYNGYDHYPELFDRHSAPESKTKLIEAVDQSKG